MPETAPPAWAGWHRPHKRTPWRRLVQAASMAEAWDALLAHQARQQGGELVVVEATRDPNREPRRPR